MPNRMGNDGDVLMLCYVCGGVKDLGVFVCVRPHEVKVICKFSCSFNSNNPS